jgi:hypothetical protein
MQGIAAVTLKDMVLSVLFDDVKKVAASHSHPCAFRVTKMVVTTIMLSIARVLYLI